MILKLCEWLKKKKKGHLEASIIFGLVLGVIGAGLIFLPGKNELIGLIGLFLQIGLSIGCITGVIIGVGEADCGKGWIAGLLGGLISFLIVGLTLGVDNLSKLIPITALSIIVLIISIIALAELIYYLFVEKKKGGYGLGIIALYKLDALFSSGLIIINLLNINWLIKNVHIKQYIPDIVFWIGIIGVFIVCLAAVIGIGYLWLKLNQRMKVK